MKKIVSVLLCLVMMMSLCTVAFAAPATPCGTDCWGNKQVPHSATTHDNVCSKCGYVWSTTECVFDQGNPCICGNTKPVATEHDCWKNLGYENLKDGHHKVYCTKCEKVLTASAECVWENGTACVCGSTKPVATEHDCWENLGYENLKNGHHKVYCTKCEKVLTASAECVWENGTACICGSTEPVCNHMGNHWIYTPVTAITHSVTCADCKVVETASTECVFTDGKCICGNVEPSCDHMANNWTYTPVTATTHSVTCNVCKAVVTESTPCVFTDGKCICGNVEPDCDHMGNHWIYTPVTKTTHRVTCADCNVVVTASTECVFEDGNPCVCGNVECKHEGAQKLVPNKDKKTHNAYCPECGELMSEKIPHTYQYNKKGEFVGKGGAYCLCGAKKSTSSKGGSTTTTTTTTTTKSPKTGDMGVVLYAATALLSLSGTAVVIKKRKNDK